MDERAGRVVGQLGCRGDSSEHRLLGMAFAGLCKNSTDLPEVAAVTLAGVARFPSGRRLVRHVERFLDLALTLMRADPTPRQALAPDTSRSCWV